jgi:CheY-like chemotaxis protein
MYKVIMIDDDEYLLRDYAECLEDLKFNVHITADIKEIIERIESEEFDAAILDIQMNPDIFDTIMAYGGKRTGLILAKKIRDLKPDIPLIALTTSTLPEMVEWFTYDDYVKYYNKRQFNELDFAISLKEYLDWVYDNNNDDDKDYKTAIDKIEKCKRYVVNNDVKSDEVLNQLIKIADILEKRDKNAVKENITETISLFSNITTVATMPSVIKELVEIIKIIF